VTTPQPGRGALACRHASPNRPYVPPYVYLIEFHNFRARHREMQMTEREFRNWRALRSRALRFEAGQ
jgi:hypothetical protein